MKRLVPCAEPEVLYERIMFGDLKNVSENSKGKQIFNLS